MIQRALLAVVALGLFVLPMTVVPDGADAFRLPKELVFRAEAIVLLGLLILRMRTPWVPIARWRPEFMLAAAIVVWAMVVTATSSNRALSIDSLITIGAAAVIFIATCVAAESRSREAIDVLMIGCCVNAAITILQELNLWQPVPATEGHYGSVGLMGNANDVGTFLVVPAVAAVVMATTSSGKRRWIYLGVAMLLVSGMIASATRTALIAFVASMLVLAAMHARRAAVVIGILLLMVGAAVLSPATVIGRGIRELGAAAMQRDYPRLFSERLPPFLAAADMVRDHPLLGVGPGGFRYHYMSYRIAQTTKYPAEWTRGFPMNWGAVHNDHLQVMAEAGVIGYLLFLASLGLVVVLVPRPPVEDTPRASFARVLRWPLATAIFLVCLAQFPLELAAPRLMLLTIGAICVTWNRMDVGVPAPGMNAWRAMLAVVLIAAAGFAVHRLCVTPFRDNLVMRDVEERMSLVENVDRFRAMSLARRNLADLERIERSRRLDAAWYMFYGANCEILERWQDAANAYTGALAIDQRPEIYFSRGLVVLHFGQIDQAVADMSRAVRFNPVFLEQISGELRRRVAAGAGLP
jgi:O-antigen ligase